MVYSTKKNPDWYKPSDFIPNYLEEEKEEKPKQQSLDDMKLILKAIAGVK